MNSDYCGRIVFSHKNCIPEHLKDGDTVYLCFVYKIMFIFVLLCDNTRKHFAKGLCDLLILKFNLNLVKDPLKLRLIHLIKLVNLYR